MAGALRRVGLTLQGTHHRGIDDARNIARLLPWSLGRIAAPPPELVGPDRRGQPRPPAMMFAAGAGRATILTAMAKPFRKMSVSERVLQRRRTSVPPQPRDDAGADAVEALHVAPLAPPPIFDQGPVFIGTDEVPAPNAEAPKAEAPKVEAAKAEAPKAEAPKAEAPKSNAPKVEAPKAEAPKAEAAKAEAPKSNAPKAEAAKAEAPKAEAAKAEAPKAEAPKAAPAEVVAAPKVESPKAKETPRRVAGEVAKGEEVERSIAPVAAPETKRQADPLDLEPFPDRFRPCPRDRGGASWPWQGWRRSPRWSASGLALGSRTSGRPASRRPGPR